MNTVMVYLRNIGRKPLKESPMKSFKNFSKFELCICFEITFILTQGIHFFFMLVI